MPVASTKSKQTINVTLEADLVAEARAVGINFSQTLTAAVQAELKSRAAEKWQRDNAAAIDYLNQLSDEHGLFSDEYRAF